MNLLREYIRELLKEDPMGFVHDLAAASEDFGEDFFGGHPGRGGGKAIKRAFNANADHQWLSTLDTVHWSKDIYGLAELLGRGKDELSTTMTLPGEPFEPIGVDVVELGGAQRFCAKPGLWVKGHISLAANDQDEMYTGKWFDYMGPYAHGDSPMADEEYRIHRQKSSGVNKLPSVSKDYSRYGQLKPGTEFGEKLARNIPYVLDQSTWVSSENRHGINEALVDNWRAVGIIVGPKLAPYIEKGNESMPGKIAEFFKVATDFDVSIYDVNRTKLWSPE